MTTGGIRAPNVRIERIKSVYQSGLDQEFERPVHGRWRGRFGLLPKSIKNIVGADRLVAVPDEFQNSPSDRSEAQALLNTELFRGRNRVGDTTGMIVLRVGKSLLECIHDHFRYNSAPCPLALMD